MNKNFRREELQVKFVDFDGANTTGSNVDGVKKAIDEIIKFNCFTLEYNYMHELFTKMNTLAVEKTGSYDWASLFSLFDKNKDNLLDKNELRELVLACGPKYAEVTEAEVAFIFNVMSFF